MRHVIEALRRYGARRALAPEYDQRKIREDYKRLEKTLSAAVDAIEAWRGNPVQIAHVERTFVANERGRAEQSRRATWDRQFKRETPCPADPAPRDPMVEPLKEFLSAVSAASASINVGAARLRSGRGSSLRIWLKSGSTSRATVYKPRS